MVTDVVPAWWWGMLTWQLGGAGWKLLVRRGVWRLGLWWAAPGGGKLLETSRLKILRDNWAAGLGGELQWTIWRNWTLVQGCLG